MPVHSNDSLPLQGKVVIITHAGYGICRPLAQALSQSGARVVVSDADLAVAQSSIAGIPGCQAAYYDPDDECSRRTLVEATVTKYGRMDAIVDGSAVLVAKPLAQL